MNDGKVIRCIGSTAHLSLCLPFIREMSISQVGCIMQICALSSLLSRPRCFWAANHALHLLSCISWWILFCLCSNKKDEVKVQHSLDLLCSLCAVTHMGLVPAHKSNLREPQELLQEFVGTTTFTCLLWGLNSVQENRDTEMQRNPWTMFPNHK